jgi:hypothetical protein
VTVRYPSQKQAACQPAGAGIEEVAWPGTVQDISASGLALRLGRRFEPGAVLSVEHPGGMLLVRVIRATRQPNGEWIIGCAFPNDIGGEEIKAWLAAAERFYY